MNRPRARLGFRWRGVAAQRLAALAAALGAVLAAGDEPRPETDAAAASPLTPRREPPASRFDFRGEHAGVIYVPRGLDEGTFPQGATGQYFTTPGGFRVFIPYAPLSGGGMGEPVALGASYEIVRPAKAGRPAAGAAGHYEIRAAEEVVPGEHVEIYHPAVYEVDASGRRRIVEKERTERVPKTRVVLTRVWVPEPPQAESGVSEPLPYEREEAARPPAAKRQP
jgi:hypothetical protein